MAKWIAVLVEDNSSLDRTLVSHTLQAFTPLFQFESLVDNTLDLHFSAIKIVDCGWEHVGLGEGTQDRNLVAKDLAWWPRDAGGSRVDTIDNKFTSTSDA
jgi:hypothetical protein